ncbi:MAG: lipase family protein [Holosporales bacterium]
MLTRSLLLASAFSVIGAQAYALEEDLIERDAAYGTLMANSAHLQAPVELKQNLAASGFWDADDFRAYKTAPQGAVYNNVLQSLDVVDLLNQAQPATPVRHDLTVKAPKAVAHSAAPKQAASLSASDLGMSFVGIDENSYEPKVTTVAGSPYSVAELNDLLTRAQLGYIKAHDISDDKFEQIEAAQKRGERVLFLGNEIENVGLVFIKPDNSVVVSLRGTDFSNPHQVAIDLDARGMDCSVLGAPMHRGMLSDVKTFEPMLHAYLKDIARAQGKDVSDLDVTVVGHSLGGGEADMVAVRAEHKLGLKNIKLVTFGAPLVMSNEAAKVFNNSRVASNAYAVVQDYDPVPKLGFNVLGGHQVGNVINLRKKNGATPHVANSYKELLNALEQLDAQGLEHGEMAKAGQKFVKPAVLEAQPEEKPAGNWFSRAAGAVKNKVKGWFGW